MHKAPSVGLLLLMVACSGETPIEPLDRSTPSLALGHVSTSEHGAIIEIDRTTAIFYNVDAARNLVSVHVPPDICAGSGLNMVDRRVITTPAEVRQRLVQIRDRTSGVVILEGSSLDPLFADFCGFLTGPARIAAGTVRHTQNLSLTAFAAHWGGTVRRTDGTRVHLSEVYQLTANLHDPNNAADWVVHAAKILLSSPR